MSKESDNNNKSSIGYFEWLQAQGVTSAFENTYGQNRTEAKNVYTFASEKEARTFKSKYLSDNTIYGDPFWDKRLKKFVMPINLPAQESLKEQFQKENPRPLTLEECERQLGLVQEATKKVSIFNIAETTKELQITRAGANYKRVADRIGNMAEALGNRQDEPGWVAHASVAAADIALSVYSATNNHLLSAEEQKIMADAQQSILRTNENGKFAGGLKTDANFTRYLKDEYDDIKTKNPDDPNIKLRNEERKGQRVKIIRENAEQLLNGGPRLIIDKDTPTKTTSFKAKANDPNSFIQPRFFPDANGKSDTDTIILHAGGMSGHTAMRAIKKEKDENAPGGYRYFYTKVDAGGGLESFNPNTLTGTGIYTTEITPFFKTRVLSNGKLAVILDEATGNPQKMTEAEIEEFKKTSKNNPEKYQRHMEAALFSLISAEREIYFYKKSEKIQVYHGEPTANTDGKFDEWKFHNNKIAALRGNEVPDRTKITPVQLTGNCTVYSTMLTVTHLTGEKIGYDIMQSAKTYNHQKALTLLKERQNAIEQDKNNIQALSNVQNVFSLKPEQVVYQTDKTSKITFADAYEAHNFKESLKKNYKIEIDSLLNSSKGKGNEITLNSAQLTSINTQAMGFKDVQLIQNFPEFKDCKIVTQEHEGQKNYIVQFNSKEEAEKFSTTIGNKYQIKSASKVPGSDEYNYKFVTTHIQGDKRYGVVLNDVNVSSLTQQLRQEEAQKLALGRAARHHGGIVGDTPQPAKPEPSVAPVQVPNKPIQQAAQVPSNPIQQAAQVPSNPVQQAAQVPSNTVQQADKAPSYEIAISEKTLEKITEYKKSLAANPDQAGEYLKNLLNNPASPYFGTSLDKMPTDQFVQALLATKKPKIFAESEVYGDGRDWNEKELKILGDINVTVPVKIYDNGVWHKTKTEFNPDTNELTTKDDPNFKIHKKRLEGELLFTPGALLKEGINGTTPDYKEVVKEEMINGKIEKRIDQEAYNALVERRLLPLLVHANEKAGLDGKPALITLPGVGAGEFAGDFKGQMGEKFNLALQNMLKKHGENFKNIAAIHYDSFDECVDNKETPTTYGNIKYRVRPQLKGNKEKTQLADPLTLQEPGDDFSKCKLYKIVAWDHVSLPGNDYFVGSRYTDDGVSAAATNSMEKITGLKGRYDKESGKYLPPEGFNSWLEVAEKFNISLEVKGNLKIVSSEGKSYSLNEFEKQQAEVQNAPKQPQMEKPIQAAPKPVAPPAPPIQPKPAVQPAVAASPEPKPTTQAQQAGQLNITQEQAKLMLETYKTSFANLQKSGTRADATYVLSMQTALNSIAKDEPFSYHLFGDDKVIKADAKVFLYNAILDPASKFNTLLKNSEKNNIPLYDHLKGFVNQVKAQAVLNPQIDSPAAAVNKPAEPKVPPQPIAAEPKPSPDITKLQAAMLQEKYGKALDDLTQSINDAKQNMLRSDGEYAPNIKNALEAIANGKAFEPHRGEGQGTHIQTFSNPSQQIYNLITGSDSKHFHDMIGHYTGKIPNLKGQYLPENPVLWEQLNSLVADVKAIQMGKEITMGQAKPEISKPVTPPMPEIQTKPEVTPVAAASPKPSQQLQPEVVKPAQAAEPLAVSPQGADLKPEQKPQFSDPNPKPLLKPEPQPQAVKPAQPGVTQDQAKETTVNSAVQILSAIDKTGKHGPRVEIKFNSQPERDQFVNSLIREAEKEGVNLKDVLDVNHSGNKGVVYIKASAGKGSVGTYISNPAAKGDFDREPELSISFNNDNLAKKFQTMLGLDKGQTYQSYGSKALYIESAAFDSQSQINTTTNYTITEPTTQVQAQVQAKPEISKPVTPPMPEIQPKPEVTPVAAASPKPSQQPQPEVVKPAQAAEPLAVSPQGADLKPGQKPQFSGPKPKAPLKPKPQPQAVKPNSPDITQAQAPEVSKPAAPPAPEIQPKPEIQPNVLKPQAQQAATPEPPQAAKPIPVAEPKIPTPQAASPEAKPKPKPLPKPPPPPKPPIEPVVPAVPPQGHTVLPTPVNQPAPQPSITAPAQTTVPSANKEVIKEKNVFVAAYNTIKQYVMKKINAIIGKDTFKVQKPVAPNVPKNNKNLPALISNSPIPQKTKEKSIAIGKRSHVSEYLLSNKNKANTSLPAPKKENSSGMKL